MDILNNRNRTTTEEVTSIRETRMQAAAGYMVRFVLLFVAFVTSVCARLIGY